MNTFPPPSGLKKRTGLLLTLAIAAVACIAGYGAYRASDAMGPVASSNGNEVGGSFRLMDSSDGTMTDTHFRGRWMLVMFGAIHCTNDACTPALTRLSTALQAVDPARKKFAPLFISLDPNRDLAMNLRQYALKFNAKIITGTAAPATLEAVAREYQAPIVRHPDPEWEYTYEISPRIVIMNPEGRYTGTIETAASAEDMEKRLRTLLEQH
ncbi:SCO family protein [Acetobacter sp.]|jgi:protein SCO1/2|uniref:SCO family protein n=1 Tax=Acetobacter sp. TaxID=440 RepID=UPI0025BE56DE|nr:SCO family protein [Acetobacter sp.]MCH4090732.1 SCO family protein [Acetobacter sp.]MCI1300552.1 SCO family protein [Acetobacter sp.]MCI1316246.1 SCO family protein [Acetobacter sp.]